MRKLFFMLIGISMFLMGAIDTIYVQRVDLYEPEIGFDHQIWSHAHQDSSLDTNYYGEIWWPKTSPIADSIIWAGAQYGTLFINTPIEVGKFNLGAVELIGDVDSLQSEYFLAALMKDFDTKPWDWRLDTAMTTTADSIFDRAILCDPFSKWFKYRLIDLRGYTRTLHIRLKFKESG